MLVVLLATLLPQLNYYYASSGDTLDTADCKTDGTQPASGHCTLRSAMTLANTTAANDNVLPGSNYPLDVNSVPYPIAVGTSLPTITQPVTIRGCVASFIFCTKRISISAASGTRLFNVSSNLSVGIGAFYISGADNAGSGAAQVSPCVFVNTNAMVNISEVSFNYCHSDRGGAITDSTGSSVSIAFSSFTNCQGDEWGGAISSVGTLSCTLCTFDNNSATGDGGAIRSDGALTLTSSTFSGNHAGNDGGAVRVVSSGAVSLSNSTFAANGASGDGGALYVYTHGAGNAQIATTSFSGNTAVFSGGAIANMENPIAISRSTFTLNDASSGGGVFAVSGLTSSQSTYYANTANRGAAIAFADPSVQGALVRNTFANNTATQASGGGALDVVNCTGCSLADAFPASMARPLTHNLFSGNMAGGEAKSCSVAGDFSAAALAGHNLITDDSCGFISGTDRRVSDAHLAPALAANGSAGPKTLALLASSAAIDAGADAVSAAATDQRGFAAIDTVTGATGAPDIGAYEFGGYSLIRAAAGPHVANEGQQLSIDVVRMRGASTVNVSAPGNADFTLDTPSLSLSGPTGTLPIVVTVSAGDAAEPRETYTLALAAAGGIDVLTPEVAFTIAPDTPALTFDAGNDVLDESVGSVSVGVTLSWPMMAPLGIPLTLAGDASLGSDYGIGTLTIPAEMTTGSFALNIVNDTVIEGDETITITALGTTRSITIANDDTISTVPTGAPGTSGTPGGTESHDGSPSEPSDGSGETVSPDGTDAGALGATANSKRGCGGCNAGGERAWLTLSVVGLRLLGGLGLRRRRERFPD